MFQFQNNTNYTLIYHSANFKPDALRYAVCSILSVISLTKLAFWLALINDRLVDRLMDDVIMNNFCLLFYWKKIDSMSLFISWTQIKSKCNKNIRDTLGCTSRAIFDSTHCDDISDLLRNQSELQYGIYIFNWCIDIFRACIHLSKGFWMGEVVAVEQLKEK